MTLYEELELSPLATPAEIRKAYLRKSKQAHPDAGGTDEQFERVHHAYLILRDPVRRARYDATGDAAGVEPDNSYAEVLATLANHLDAVMHDNLKNIGGMFLTGDWVDAVRQKLRVSYQSIDIGLKEQRKAKSYWQRLSGRFTRATEPSVLAQIVEARIADVDRGIAEGERRTAVLDKALDLLKEERFRCDERAPMTIPVAETFKVQGLWNTPFA